MRQQKTGWRYRAFGLTVRSEFPLAGMTPVADENAPTVSIGMTTREEVDGAWPGTVNEVVGTLPDGSSYRGERAHDGRRRLTYDQCAVYLLSADTSKVLCAPTDFEEPSWQRFLLDAVLLKVSETHGFEALHASAVEGPAGVLAFATSAGGGKSSLAAELVRRGRPFFADDAVAIARIDGSVRAYASPPLMSLPLAEPARLRPTEIGDVLGTFGDEAWVRIREAASGPCRLAGIYLLTRRPGLRTGLEPLAPSPVHLLPHALTGGGSAARLASRFELLADLAAETPAYRLRAPLEAPVAELADLVERSHENGRTPRTERPPMQLARAPAARKKTGGDPGSPAAQSGSGGTRRGYAFGLDLEGAFPVRGLFEGSSGDPTRRTSLRVVSVRALEAAWRREKAPPLRELRDADGRRLLTIEEDAELGYRMDAPAYGRYLVSQDGSRILCAPKRIARWQWHAFLIGQVLPLAAVLHGLEVAHGSAVGVGGRAIGLVGPSGGGKSSLAVNLARRGAAFITDDVLVLERRGERIHVHPGAALASVRHAEASAIGPEALERLGTVVGRDDQELRMAVEREHRALPIGALYFIERSEREAQRSIEKLSPPGPGLLLGSTFNGFVRRRDRLVTQLDLYAHLSRAVPTFRAVVSPGIDAATLAGRLEDHALSLVEDAARQ